MIRLPMKRPSWTLYRMTFGEFWRLVGLSTFVLVSVIAFAAAVKPLSDGLLQAGDGIRFILLASLPMLAYALPFAAGFASTLVYHRMASDNETTAAYAGGVSHRSLLMPAVISGVVLSLGLGLLNEQVIPRFLQRMEQMITVDVARLLAQEIGKGKAVELNGMLVYADRVKRLTPDPASGASDELLLSNFAVLPVDKEGRPTSEATASLCRLWLLPGDSEDEGRPGSGQMRVMVRLQHVRGVQPGERLVAQSDDQTISWLVPNAFRDNPKFLTRGELRRLKAEPERMNWIDSRRRHLAVSLQARLGLESIGKSLSDRGLATLEDPEGRRVSIAGHGVEPVGGEDWDRKHWRVLPDKLGVPIVVTVEKAGQSRLIFESSDVVVVGDITHDDAVRRAIFTVELGAARVRAGGETSVERAKVELRGLSTTDPEVRKLLSLNSERLIAMALPRIDAPAHDSLIEWPARELVRKLGGLRREVLSKQQERLALSVSCAVMVLTGAVTALRFSKSLPLSVYLWTFFPALASLVTISGGQQLVSQVGAPGLLLMWSGVAGLSAYTLVLLVGLVRH